jgi:hypothetical protein
MAFISRTESDMNTIVILSIMVGFATLLAIAAILLAMSVTPSALSRDVKNLRLEFNDLFDFVDHFMKRDRTRKSREPAPPEPVPVAEVDKKAELRKRAGLTG